MFLCRVQIKTIRVRDSKFGKALVVETVQRSGGYTPRPHVLAQPHPRLRALILARARAAPVPLPVPAIGEGEEEDEERIARIVSHPVSPSEHVAHVRPRVNRAVAVVGTSLGSGSTQPSGWRRSTRRSTRCTRSIRSTRSLGVSSTHPPREEEEDWRWRRWRRWRRRMRREE